MAKNDVEIIKKIILKLFRTNDTYAEINNLLFMDVELVELLKELREK